MLKARCNLQRVTTTPGEMLLDEFMVPLSISQNQLASDLRVPPGRINQIINGKRGITSDTALRLAKYFGNSPEFWLNLQQMYDLSKTRLESGGLSGKCARGRGLRKLLEVMVAVLFHAK
ncbi:MAG TPA: HigA family addiction module antitoxin [Acidobacteriaceae bacterium]|nr:HigA family addiction module antitoxin [Acidobacteriaceae bacterium]